MIAQIVLSCCAIANDFNVAIAQRILDPAGNRGQVRPEKHMHAVDDD
jgi:hypothetical protein